MSAKIVHFFSDHRFVSNNTENMFCIFRCCYISNAIGPVLLKHSSQHVNGLYFSRVDSLITAIHPNAIPLKRHGLRWMR